MHYYSEHRKCHSEYSIDLSKLIIFSQYCALYFI